MKSVYTQEQQTKILQLMNELDSETYLHSLRVGRYCIEIADVLEFSEDDVERFFVAGLLHDIGKSKMPEQVLNSESEWTDEDMEIMKGHVTEGYNLLKEDFPFLAEIALRHHSYQGERSYPEKLNTASEKVNFFSRLISVADFYDAWSSRKNKSCLSEMSFESLKEKISEYHPKLETELQKIYRSDIFI